MRKIEELKIGDETYLFGHWDPEHALRMFTRLVKLIGEPMARILIGVTNETKKKGGLDKEISEEEQLALVGPAITSLAARLDEDEVVSFFKDAQEQVKCGGVEVRNEFKHHYTGKLGAMMTVTIHQVRFQFKDFLGLLPVLKSKL